MRSRTRAYGLAFCILPSYGVSLLRTVTPPCFSLLTPAITVEPKRSHAPDSEIQELRRHGGSRI